MIDGMDPIITSVHQWLTLPQAAALLDIGVKKFVSRAADVNMKCEKGFDGRGITRKYQLREILQHRESLCGDPALLSTRNQRNRCIMALRQGLGLSYRQLAAVVGNITFERIRQILDEQKQSEKNVHDAISEALGADKANEDD